MNRFEQLLSEYCPNGVDYRPLKEYCTFTRGESATRNNLEEGNIPVIAGGRTPAYYTNRSNRAGDCVTIAGSGANAGFVSYWPVPVFVSDAFTVDPSVDCCPKYVYYLLSNIQETIFSTQTVGGIPHVYGANIANFTLPVPPLPVQEEIVRILDTYTALVEELESQLNAELAARARQYEYYRDDLLNFDPERPHASRPTRLNQLIQEHCPNGVDYYSLTEIFYLRNGYTPSKADNSFWDGGTIPWFRMEDIRVNGSILTDSIAHITPTSVKGKLFEAYTIIMATSATIGDHALIKVPYLSNQRFTNLTPKPRFKELLKPEFVYYYCFLLAMWARSNVNTSGFASVDMDRFRKFRFPIPPMQIQEEIVAILDRFDALVNDLKDGLPAEIAARRKQYEYYRDQLLTFKPLEKEEVPS